MTGTVIIGGLLLAAVAAIAVNLARAKQKGKCAGCSCASGCPASRACCGKISAGD